MANQPNDLFLRRALLGNAAFSTLCGLVLLLGAGPLEPHLGVPSVALRVVGVVLLPFAFGLWRNARQPEVSRSEAWTAVVLDAVWVLGSIAILVGKLWPLESAGFWAVIAIAEVVGLCAVLQAIGLRRSAVRSSTV